MKVQTKTELTSHELLGAEKQTAEQLWTHRYPRVLVEDDLQQVWGEDGRGLEALLGFEHVLFLSIQTWGGAGEI